MTADISTTESAHPGSKFAHVPLAIGWQIVVGLMLISAVWTTGPIVATIWIPGFAALMWCVSREVTQYEYQYIQLHGGLRANMPEFEGLKFWKWDKHSIDETALAALAVFILSSILTFIFA